LAYQENKKNGSKFLVEESPCKISAPRVFSVAQNLRAKLGLLDSIQMAPEVLTTKQKRWV
jgi:hypothetical protein